MPIPRQALGVQSASRDEGRRDRCCGRFTLREEGVYRQCSTPVNRKPRVALAGCIGGRMPPYLWNGPLKGTGCRPAPAAYILWVWVASV